MAHLVCPFGGRLTGLAHQMCNFDRTTDEMVHPVCHSDRTTHENGTSGVPFDGQAARLAHHVCRLPLPIGEIGIAVYRSAKRSVKTGRMAYVVYHSREERRWSNRMVYGVYHPCSHGVEIARNRCRECRLLAHMINATNGAGSQQGSTANRGVPQIGAAPPTGQH